MNKIKRIFINVFLLSLVIIFILFSAKLYNLFRIYMLNPKNTIYFFGLYSIMLFFNIFQLWVILLLPEKVDDLKFKLKLKEKKLENKIKEQNIEFKDKAVKFTSLMVKVKDIATAIDKETLFSSIIDVLKKGLNAEKIDIFMVDKNKKECFLVRSTHHPPGTDIRISLSEESLLTKAIQEGIFIIKEEARKNSILSGLIDKGKIPTVVALPLHKGDEIAGVINIEKLKENAETISDEERLLLTTIGGVSALAMKNANVYELTREELISQKKISQKELEEKKKIKEILSKYTSPSVMEEVLKNPSMLKLGGEKRIATVMFSDIRSFTTYSEKYSPEKVVAILNEYLSAMTNIIMKYNGTLDKFVGDEIMALWGVPVHQEDHAKLAIKAAWEMVITLKELQKTWVQKGIEPFDIGIGINTGEMIAGNMGSEQRMDYTVIGDHVNTASRIEGLTRKFNCHIIISEFTFDRVKDIVKTKKLGYVQVKGKSQKILVYKVENVEL